LEKLFLSRGRPGIHVRQCRTLDKRASPRQKIDVSAYRTEPAGRHTCLFMLGFHENRAQCGKACGLAPCRHPVGSLVLRPYDVRLCSIVAERLAGPWPSKQRSRLQQALCRLDAHLPLLRCEQQPGVGLAVRKHVPMRWCADAGLADFAAALEAECAAAAQACATACSGCCRRRRRTGSG
jgi:hypothetical protein